MKAKMPREARQAHMEYVMRTAPCERMRLWAAGELGKIWAEEALEEINARLGAMR